MRALLAATVILASTAASAQTAPNASVGPDNGFFRPTPGNDPSLTHPPMVTLTSSPAMPPQPQPTAAVPVYVPVQVGTPPAPVNAAEQQVRAEQDLDRAQREAEEAQQRARQQPAPINGAFTGQTNERDR